MVELATAKTFLIRVVAINALLTVINRHEFLLCRFFVVFSTYSVDMFIASTYFGVASALWRRVGVWRRQTALLRSGDRSFSK